MLSVTEMYGYLLYQSWPTQYVQYSTQEAGHWGEFSEFAVALLKKEDDVPRD